MTANFPTDWEMRQEDSNRSPQCQSHRHKECSGFYDTAGFSPGYETYTCWCSVCDHHNRAVAT